MALVEATRSEVVVTLTLSTAEAANVAWCIEQAPVTRETADIANDIRRVLRAALIRR